MFSWYLTPDNRIAITGGNQCLDQGNAQEMTQTYQCTTGNTNQSELHDFPCLPFHSKRYLHCSHVPVWNVIPDEPAASQIKWAKDGENLCATVMGGTPGNGAVVALSTCLAPGTEYYGLQLFQQTSNNFLQLAGTNFCLDAGVNPANGSGMKIWTCYDGLLQQTWSVNANRLISLGNNQCLDVTLESGRRDIKPYGSLKDLQTWQCSATDPQQLFVLL